MKSFKRILVASTIIVFILALFACGVNNQKSYAELEFETTMASMSYGAAYRANSKMAVNEAIVLDSANGDASYTSFSGSTDRKIRKTVDINAETKTFDESLETVKSFVSQYNGIIDNSYIDSGNANARNYSKNAHFSVRIPAEKLDEFLSKIGSKLNITFKQENISDITDEYSDTESRLNSLKIEEESLNNMLKKAKTVEEMIKVEDKLSSVRSEIANITKRLNRYDKQVTYSTVNISVTEVRDLTEVVVDEEDYSRETLIKKLRKNIEDVKKFLRKLGANIFTNIPWIVLILTALLILTLLYALFKAIFFRRPRKVKKFCGNNDDVDVNVYDAKDDIAKSDDNVESAEKNDDSEDDKEDEVEVEIYQ